MLALDHNPAPALAAGSAGMQFASEAESDIYVSAAPQGLDTEDLPAPEGASLLQPGFQSQARSSFEIRKSALWGTCIFGRSIV
jgi:hypothetical protein